MSCFSAYSAVKNCYTLQGYTSKTASFLLSTNAAGCTSTYPRRSMQAFGSKKIHNMGGKGIIGYSTGQSHLLCHLLHNLHAMQENLHWGKQGGDGRTASVNTYETQNKTIQMRPNQSRAILIFPITPTTT